jgi:hypothetical protein
VLRDFWQALLAVLAAVWDAHTPVASAPPGPAGGDEQRLVPGAGTGHVEELLFETLALGPEMATHAVFNGGFIAVS